MVLGGLQQLITSSVEGKGLLLAQSFRLHRDAQAGEEPWLVAGVRPGK